MPHAAVIAFANHQLAPHPAEPLQLAIRIAAAPPIALKSGARSEDLLEHRVDEGAVSESESSITIATAPRSVARGEAAPVRTLPRRGRITFDLVYGRARFPVGRTVQTWETDGTHYRLASRSETTGIVDLIRSQQQVFNSQGSLTADGLRPESFAMSRNRGRGAEESRASFDWKGASVTLVSASGARNETLPKRTQDLLSLMYQLAVNPPPRGRFSQPVTNGARLEIYQLDVLAEETIETPIGKLRAMPVLQIRKPGEESLQLWLASEHPYLPIRIRFFGRDGEPQGDQIVTEIRVSDE